MAIVLNQEDLEKQKQAQAPQAGGQMLGGSSGGAASAAAPKRPQGSGMFTNLQRYINANKGNQAVQGAVGEISGKADEAQNNFNQAQAGLNGIQASPNDYSKQAGEVDKWMGGASRALSDASASVYRANQLDSSNLNRNELIQTALTNQASTQADIEKQRQEQLKKVQGWQYSGPQEADVNNAYEKAEAARQAGVETQGLFSDENRRADFLKSKYNAGRGDYSGGMNRLDTFLVGNAGRDQFAAKKAALQSVVDSGVALSDKSKALTSQVQKNRSAVDQQRQSYFDRLNKYI